MLYAISRDSLEHAWRLELIGTWLNLFEKADCEDVIGEPWRRLKSIEGALSRGEAMDFGEFFDKMSWFERAIGEETYNKLLISLLKKSVGAFGVSEEVAEFVTELLGCIANDEKRHEEWMLKLRERAARK